MARKQPDLYDQMMLQLEQLQLVMLSGDVWPKLDEMEQSLEDLHKTVTATLAVVRAETPRIILEEAFENAPTDEEWRERLLPQRVALHDEGRALAAELERRAAGASGPRAGWFAALRRRLERRGRRAK